LLGYLHKVVVHEICFLTAFCSGAEIGLLLSVFLKPTTITSVVRVIHTPVLLAQVAMILKTDFLGNPDRKMTTLLALSTPQWKLIQIILFLDLRRGRSGHRCLEVVLVSRI
jgi:hypothetical protein